MSFTKRQASKAEEPGVNEELREDGVKDLALEEALKSFRLSVHAWSDAAYHRPRTMAQVVRHRSWRLAAGWALTGLLAVSGAGGGLYARHHQLDLARIAAAERAAEQQKLNSEQQGLIREEQAKEQEENLLVTVDSDISRTVPSAMEPLAQLMDDEAQ
jgi:hypothetical protein